MSTQNIFQDQINLQTPDFLKKQDSADGFITMPEFIHDNGTHPDATRTGSIGSMFKQARLAKNLEIKDVANRLKVSPAIIQQIEKDALEKLGPPVFVRNHLKRYAQLIDLSETEVIERYKTLGIDALPPLKVAHPVKVQSHTADLRWISYPLIAVVVIWLGWLGLERLTSHLALSGSISIPGLSADNDDSSLALPGQTIPTVTVPVDSGETPVGDGGDNPNRVDLPGMVNDSGTATAAPLNQPDELSSSAQNAPLALPEQDSATPPVETDDAETGPVTGSLIPDTTTGSAGQVIGADGTVGELPAPAAPPAADVGVLDEQPENFHELIMQFSADCWVEIKDANDERLAYGIIKANEVRTLNGEMPFSITLGNAAAAQIKLDGQPVNPTVYSSDTRGGVARFVLDPPSSG